MSKKMETCTAPADSGRHSSQGSSSTVVSDIQDTRGKDRIAPADLEANKAADGSTHPNPGTSPSEKLPAKSQSAADPNLVDWDGPQDPLNPLNFPEWRKWTILLVIGSACLCVTCASSMAALTYPGMEEDFGVGREVSTLSITLFIAGLGTGPLFLAPLSEFYGRRPIYNIGYFFYAALGFLPAFAPFSGLCVGRFFQGVAGSAFLSVAGGSVTDMWAGHKVGAPMAIYSACPFLGPILGPIISGFINSSVHWRWTYYVLLMWSFAELALVILLAPETYAPKILKSKAARLRKKTGNEDLYTAREKAEREMGMSKTMFVLRSTGRPFQILLFEPMASLLCLWCALLLGILYMFFGAFPLIFRGKGFSTSEVGLSFLGMGLGIGTATLLNATVWTRVYARTAKRLGSRPPPEEHLKKGMVAAVLGPISLFWFAWVSQPSVHWAIAIVASIPFGMAFTFAFTASFTYLVDAYRPYAASAMGANSFLRSAFAAAFPLFAVQMYEKLGVSWAGTLVAFLLLAMTPLPFLFFRYGERLRKRSRFSDAGQ